MKLITITWKERGYTGINGWATAECPAALATATARQLMAEARQNGRVFGLRARISNHPTKS